MEDYLNTPCPRCGSKRVISRSWNEKLKTFSGTIEVEHTKIICINKICQKNFEEQRAQEAKKREEERLKKEKRLLERKLQKSSLKNKAAKLKK